MSTPDPTADARALEKHFAARRTEALSSPHPDSAADAAVFTLAGAAARIYRDYPEAHTMCISSHIDGNEVTFLIYDFDGSVASYPGDTATAQLQHDLQTYGQDLPAPTPVELRKPTDPYVNKQGFIPMHVRLTDIVDQANAIPTRTTEAAYTELECRLDDLTKITEAALNEAATRHARALLGLAAAATLRRIPEAVAITFYCADAGTVDAVVTDATGRHLNDSAGDGELPTLLWKVGRHLPMHSPFVMRPFALGFDTDDNTAVPGIGTRSWGAGSMVSFITVSIAHILNLVATAGDLR